MHTSVGHRMPSELVFDIENFKGSRSRESSLSSTPDGLCTPPSEKKADYFAKVEKPAEHPVLMPNHSSSNKIRDIELSKTNNNTTNTISIDVADGVQSTIAEKNQRHTNGGGQIQAAFTNDSILSNAIREIPKSPHLSKDFSPNGDRIRNSIRARRQERMLRQRSERNMSNISISPGPSSLGDLSETNQNANAINESNTDSNGTLGEFSPMGNTIKRQRSRPYGEKGFILNLNDGLLSLNDVKNLDNCSDFDSSCDTSLNYIDINNPSLNDNHSIRSTSKLPSTSTIVETTPTTEAPPKDFDILGTSESSAERKNALDEIKRQLNLCKTKLEALEMTDSKPQSPTKLNPFNNEISLASLPSVSPPKKHTNGTKFSNDLDLLFSTPKTKSPTKPYSMFSRLNPLSPIFGSKQRGKVIINETYPPAKYPTEAPTVYRLSETPPPLRSTRLFRINDTPIFERRKIHSLLPSKLFKRSDSDDNIMLTPDSTDMFKPNRLTDNDRENVQQRKNGKHTNNQYTSDRTSPIRKYFSMNQPKIQSKSYETTKLDHAIKSDQCPRQKTSKPLTINPMKYSVKKSPSPILHSNPTAPNCYVNNINYGKPKHVYVNYMDPGCSTSNPHPIGLQEKSAKFSSLFDYDTRLRNVDKSVAPSVKMPPARKTFRN